MEIRTSLVCTTYNESGSIEELLESIESQTRAPDEIIIVDAGSDDGTIETIERYDKESKIPLNLIVDDGCNIPEGRNIAIRNAQFDIITVVDGGTILDNRYVEKIIKPFSEDKTVDVVSGYYLPRVSNLFQKCTARFAYIPQDKIDPESFLPSARSVAFRKTAWEDVGECPEHLNFADDTIFDLRLKEAGKKFEFQPEAIVYWDHDADWQDFLRRRFQYSYWAGKAGLERGRWLVGLRVLTAILITVFAFSKRSLTLGLSLLFGIGLIGFLDTRQINELDTDVNAEKREEFSLMIAIRVLNDIVTISGFISGKTKRMLNGPPKK